MPAPATALTVAGLACAAGPGATLRVQAPVEAVGRAAADAGQVLTDLRAGEDVDLEEWFLALTADAQLVPR